MTSNNALLSRAQGGSVELKIAEQRILNVTHSQCIFHRVRVQCKRGANLCLFSGLIITLIELGPNSPRLPTRNHAMIDLTLASRPCVSRASNVM